MLISEIFPTYRVDIIGIAGRIETNKKQFAAILQKKLEKISTRSVVRVGFADQIRQTLINLFSPGLTQEMLFGKEADKAIPGHRVTGRKLMTGFSRYCRSINPRVWIDYVFKRRLTDYIYIIQDVRHHNEVEEILKHNGIIIGLEHPDTVFSTDDDDTEKELYKHPFDIRVNVDENIENDIDSIIGRLNVS